MSVSGELLYFCNAEKAGRFDVAAFACGLAQDLALRSSWPGLALELDAAIDECADATCTSVAVNLPCEAHCRTG